MAALELQQIEKPFDHPEWIFEIKFDGVRALAAIEMGRAISSASRCVLAIP
jgi:ATP-dependent DNA ligase